jgi:hypothetical protein
VSVAGFLPFLFHDAANKILIPNPLLLTPICHVPGQVT